MGRQTKTFRQTKKSGSADTSYKNYARINRGERYVLTRLVKQTNRSKNTLQTKYS